MFVWNCCQGAFGVLGLAPQSISPSVIAPGQLTAYTLSMGKKTATSAWEVEGQAIQERLNEVDRRWKAARTERDKENPELLAHHKHCVRLEDEWNRLNQELAEHMRKRP